MACIDYIDCMDVGGCVTVSISHQIRPHISPPEVAPGHQPPDQELYIYGFIGTKNQGHHIVDLFITMMNRRRTMCIVSVKLSALIPMATSEKCIF